MKTTISFLSGVTFATVVLLGVYLYSARPVASTAGPDNAKEGTPLLAEEAAGTATLKPEPSISLPVAAEPGPGFWARWVEDADYRTYIDNLRRIGCPEPTLADIVIADLERLFAESGPDLLHTQLGSMARHPEAAAIEDARDAVIAELLGANWEQHVPRPIHEGLAVAGLEAEQAEAVRAVEATYSAEVNRIYRDAGLAWTSLDEAALDQARIQRQQALAEVLDHETLWQYEQRNCDWLATLREDSYFSFTPDELEALFAVSLASAPQPDGSFGSEPDPEEFLRVLGAERYAVFEESRDFRYQQIHDLARRYGGNETEVASEIIDLWDADLDWSDDPTDHRTPLLQTRIAELLGHEAADRFAQIAAQWGE